ncbi:MULTISPECIES: glycine-rich domain-containing protein [Streptomycetaceae]|uniref:Uncharacterized protein n=1 Tax=Streptantibioticus cattleyicolor (strain ATCC 35852 / DSM 46488 / JCM 4925 / NBRC 14057 / NRRL 8057) TaxID=1003195 RepID=F8K4D9_STREN|nr:MULTISPECIES: hypothetical protein [Streptomycetaceae]AEW93899.1 hypothetical protein SCATT_15280 [Streptantibioticus cattleyicolor NRRL 8057 = DSM 46488]MYS58579.1 hypothetical protein [Streptomyces sp. SID5468]CCB74246.1 protein of unknown function [Streptantibioticus cattleyicolor NRRL 8057 = DSM 46488]
MTVCDQLGVRELLPATDRAGVIATVLRANPGMDHGTAERIVDEAIKFVVAATTSPGRGLRPSRIVDEGWHALILHTRVYAALCGRLGGFVHHVPEPPNAARHDPGALARTQDAIRAAGYQPDPALWLPPSDTSIPVAASCEHSPPGPEGTCTESCAPSGPN